MRCRLLLAGLLAQLAWTNVGVAQDDLDDLDDLDALDELDAELDALDELSGEGDAGFRLREVSGFFGSQFRVYPADRGGPTRDEELLLELELEIDVDLGGGFSLFLRPWALTDTLDADLARYEPLEGYLDYRAERWDLRAGQFIESWGIADTFNPIDVLNRDDLAIDVLEPKSRGELGARLRVHFEGGAVVDQPSLAFYVMPVWRSTEFPIDGSRFSFSGVDPATGAEIGLLDEDAERLDVDDGLLGAVRFEHTLNAGAFAADMQYLAVRGPDRFPSFAPVPQDDGSIGLVPEYHGTWIFGGGFRAVPTPDWWSKLTLKAEVVYKKPYRIEDRPAALPDDYLQFAFGVDRLFPYLLSQKDQLTLTIEYVGEALADDPQSEFRPFDHDVVLRFYWEANDFARTSFELRGILDVSHAELISEAIVRRQLRFIHEDLRLEVGGRYIRPTEDEPSFLGRFPDNSSVYARLQLDF